MMRFRLQTNPVVFGVSVVVILAFLIAGIVATDAMGRLFDSLQSGIAGTLGWYYILVVTGFLVFVVWLGASRFGRIRLGPPDSKPEYRYLTWFAMLFAAGMGIGLVFWAVAEPLSHLANPPMAEGGTAEAARTACRRDVRVSIPGGYVGGRSYNRPVAESPLLTSLNPVQRDAVLQTEGPVLFVAGSAGDVPGAQQAGLPVIWFLAPLGVLAALFPLAAVAHIDDSPIACRLAQLCAILYPLVVLLSWPRGHGIDVVPGTGPWTAVLACAVIVVTAGATAAPSPRRPGRRG
jgi:hypothetical protein